MNLFALLFSLSAIGISETVYLIRKRIGGEHAFCVIGGGCTNVLESKYNSLFGIHFDILGLLYYLSMAAITALYVLEVQPIALIDVVASLLVATGALMSVGLTFIQAKLIRSWCFWCLMSACTIWTMAALVLGRNALAFFAA